MPCQKTGLKTMWTDKARKNAAERSHSLGANAKRSATFRERRRLYGPSEREQKHLAELLKMAHEASRGRVPWNKGKKTSIETRTKLSLSHMGQPAWNKGKTLPGNAAKLKARSDLNNAVRDGRIVRPSTCSLCDANGGRSIVAHHGDYARPYTVIWVCTNCHKDRPGEVDLLWQKTHAGE